MISRFRRWLGLKIRQPEMPEFHRVTPYKLHEAIDEADQLVVRSSFDESLILFESVERHDLDQLKEIVTLVEFPLDRVERCLCTGSEVVELYRKGQRTVQLTYHHGTSVRCDSWGSDARIVDRNGWLDWLASHRPVHPPMDVLRTGDSFAAIMCRRLDLEGGPEFLVLRMSLADGRRVIVDPCEVALPGERYPALGLSIEEVEDFPVVRRWPDGPVDEANPLEALIPYLNKRISRVLYSDSAGEGAISRIEIAFEDESAFSICHSSQPMTLEVECIA